MLSDGRREKMLQRVGRLLREVDPAVHLHNILLDSTRSQLVIVMQKGEQPLLVGMNYLDYVSFRDEDLRSLLASGLSRRLEVARRRQAQEQES